MKLEQNEFDNISVLAISGRLDHESTPALEAKVERLVAECVARGGSMVMDLSEVGYVSSIALRCVFRISKTISAAGGSFVLSALQPVVREIFAISGLDSRITIKESAEMAIGGVVVRCSGGLPCSRKIGNKATPPGKFVGFG